MAEDHQTKNAMALVNKQAAVMVKDAEVVERLGEVMERLLQDDGERNVFSHRKRLYLQGIRCERIC